MATIKPYEISKISIWEAWKSVKKNHGSHGIDKQTIENFEAKLKDNLFKLWNRMSSVSYFPPSVRKVEIPKKDGGVRTLGIPTVEDRIAQTVVKKMLEPQIDPFFHQNSYGYRPNKSALDAIAKTRERCWDFKWVIDLDIKGFFDNMNHELLMKALKKHTDCKWVLLYIERWLKAPLENMNGEKIERTKGTPQGGVISPLISNLFMHYALDKWLEINFPHIKFSRYADDIVIHCVTEKQASFILQAVKKRLSECFLELHPEKTKIVYCKKIQNPTNFKVTAFDFLGYTFRSRAATTKEGVLITGFLPAISKKSLNNIREQIRKWKLKHWTSSDIYEIALALNPVIQGWLNYYCAYHSSRTLNKISRAINNVLVKWAKRKYKSLGGMYSKSANMIRKLFEQNPKLFAHWKNSTTFYYAG
jgi:RNA-directed DNA polymerase